MNTIMIISCLICAIFASPITINIALDSLEHNSNSTETLLVAQSSGNSTSDMQSSESDSLESVESESSENTSEESDSVESKETELLVETRDDSMGSDENIRKSWLGVFATVVRDASVEDNSTEVKSQPEILNHKKTEKQTLLSPTVKTFKQSSGVKEAPEQKATLIDSSSESAESAYTTRMSFTAVSSESSESNETSSEASDSASESAQSSESSEEDSNSDSKELSPIKDCVNGTQSCESEEYFFQDIGDDANYSVDNFMVPDEDDRELSLRR